MTSTITPSQYMNPMLNQYRKRVSLKRSTQQINDPYVVQQMKFANTPNKTKKSVRFHQDNMEQVRYFYKSQSPLTVKSDPPFMDASADDYKLSQPNWPSRNNIFYNTENKIRMENVQLIDGDYEQMADNKLVIEGRCRAFNLSFHKLVSIRYTFDLWRTYQETTGEFRESIASTSNTWDRFSFHIPIEAKQNFQSLYLALRYTVDDQEFWDNNNGMNYEVVITLAAEKSVIADEQVEQEEAQVEQEQEQVITTTTTTTTTTTEEDEEELALMMNTKKDNTKVLGRRYDFTASLSAARKPYFASPPPSPPGTPIDTENFSYTPPVFFSDSQFTNDTPTYHLVQPQQEVQKKPDPIPIKTSAMNTPPASPPISAEGFQMSYSDFVNKYCFYNSHSNPIYSTYSTSPSAVLS